MQLILVRHGPAGSADPERWPDDRKRPLSPRGRRRTSQAARGLARLVPHPDRVWTSSLLRARQTARRVVRALEPRPKVEIVGALAPGGDILARLAEHAQRMPEGTVVLVGHEPDLGHLAARLIGSDAIALPLKKAGACRIDVAGLPRRGAGTLVWFLSPRILRALGRKRIQAP